MLLVYCSKKKVFRDVISLYFENSLWKCTAHKPWTLAENSCWLLCCTLNIARQCAYVCMFSVETHFLPSTCISLCRELTLGAKKEFKTKQTNWLFQVKATFSRYYATCFIDKCCICFVCFACFPKNVGKEKKKWAQMKANISLFFLRIIAFMRPCAQTFCHWKQLLFSSYKNNKGLLHWQSVQQKGKM